MKTLFKTVLVAGFALGRAAANAADVVVIVSAKNSAASDERRRHRQHLSRQIDGDEAGGQRECRARPVLHGRWPARTKRR